MADDGDFVDAEAGPGRGRGDLTTGPIARTLLAFTLPTLASNILQSLNGSINSIWVGRFLGENALAATSNANLVMFLMYSAVFGFGMAATVLVGQSIGRGNLVEARRAFATAIGAFVALAVVIAFIGWLTAPKLLHALGTPPEALMLALDYLRVVFLTMPGTFMLVLLMMGLRGSGDALTPLWFMILSVILDSGLNPVFILGLGPAPRMGIAGSAAATLIANYVSVAGLIVYIYARDLPMRLRGAEWRFLLPDRVLVRTILAKGLPMGLQMIVMSAAGMAMIGLVNRLGVETVAAYGIAQQLWTYIQMPAMAIGGAVSAMAAQNIGAGRWDRVSQMTRVGLFYNLIVTGSMVVILTLFDRQLLLLFIHRGSPAIGMAEHMNLLVGWSFVLMGVSMVMSGVMRANGAAVAPLVILVIASFPVRLTVAYFGQPWLGADAIWWSFSASGIAAALLTTVYFRRGGWRRVKLVDQVSATEAEERTHADGDALVKMSPTA